MALSRPLRRSVLALAMLATLAGLPPPPAVAGSWAKATIAAGDLNDVGFASDQVGWAVGNGGAILRTLDGGATWTAQTSKTTQVLNGVDFVDTSRGWAVGAGSTVRSTTDGGQTWTIRATGIDAVLLGVDFVDATHGWAVGSTALLANLVLATEDGGVTWTPQAAPAGIGLVAVSFADRLHGFTAGYLDAAYRTEDGGKTWVPMAVKVETFDGLTTDSFYATVRTSPTDGLLGGFRGEVYRTEDGGLTWAPAGSLAKPIRGLATAGTAAFASGDTGAVARSDDGGKTWQTEASSTASNLKGISAASPALAFTVGAVGTLVTYRDAPHSTLPLDVSLLPETCGALDMPWRHETAGVTSWAVAVDIGGSTEIVSAGPLGIRALRPFAPTEQATRWYRPLQSSVHLIRVAETDGDPLPEVVASTGNSDAARMGIIALAAESGAVLWSRRLPAGTVTFQLGDFDGDGLEDVAAITAARDLRLLSGLDGTNLRQPFALPSTPQDLELVHLDGDAAPEMVVPMVNGRVLVLDGQTGALRWTYRVDGDLRTVTAGDLTGDGTPDVVLGGTGVPGSVTPGRGDDQTNIGSIKGAMVVALDGRDGRRLWDYGQNNPFMHFDALALGDLTGDGTPDVVGHAARYQGSHLLALDGRGMQAGGASTGEPRVLWRHRTSNGGDIQSVYTPESLSLADGNGDGVPDAYTAQWSGDMFAVSGAIPASPPADPTRPADAERLWFAGRDWQMYQATPVRVDGERFILAVGGDGLLALRDLATGEIAWSFDGGTFPALTPAGIDGDDAMEAGFGTSGGRVYALDGDGALLSSGDVFLPDRVVDIAATDVHGDSRDELVAVSVDGTAAAIDPRDSEVLWSMQLGAEPQGVATGDGIAAVALADGRLVGLDASTGVQSWSIPGTIPVNDVVRLPRAGLFAAGDDAGTLRFVDVNGAIAAEGSSGAAIASLTAGDLDGDGLEEVVAASGPSFQAFGADGGARWSVGTGQATSDTGLGDMDGDGLADVVGVALGRAHGIRGVDGDPMWDREISWPGGAAVVQPGDSGPGQALVGSNRLFFDGRITAVRANGSVAGDCEARTLPSVMAGMDLDGDGRGEALVATREGHIYAVSGA